jgi:hypothetical protein
MLRRVALVRTDVSYKRSASIIRVTGIDVLGTLAVTSNRTKLRRNATYIICLLVDGGHTFFRNVGSTRATWCDIPEDGILHSHRRENLKSYINICWNFKYHTMEICKKYGMEIPNVVYKMEMLCQVYGLIRLSQDLICTQQRRNKAVLWISVVRRSPRRLWKQYFRDH